MKLTITHHAKVRWFEKFNRIINRIQIEDEIEYNFEKQTEKEIFVGSFSGTDTGKGFAKCLLIPLNDDLFSIKEFESELSLLIEEEKAILKSTSMDISL